MHYPDRTPYPQLLLLLKTAVAIQAQNNTVLKMIFIITPDS